MVIYEQIEKGGIAFTLARSDKGVKIERNGNVYDDAIDPVGSGRTYQETDIPVTGSDVTEADKDAALRRFGVEV